MPSIGPLELMVIFFIALVVVGPKKLPELGRAIGNGLREFRKAQDEVRRSLELDELQDVRREIVEAERGVRDAMQFETPPASERGPSVGSEEAEGEPLPRRPGRAEAAATDRETEPAAPESPADAGDPGAPDP